MGAVGNREEEHLNKYLVMLYNGKELTLSRDEGEGKSAIGLWIWSSSQKVPVHISFREGTIKADSICFMSMVEEEEEEDDTELSPLDHIGMINPPVSTEYLDLPIKFSGLAAEVKELDNEDLSKIEETKQANPDDIIKRLVNKYSGNNS